MKVFIDDVIVEGEVKSKIYIESNSLEYQVNVITVRNKEGVETVHTQTLGHFISLEACVKYVMNMKIKESTSANLSELVQDLKSIKASIESLFSL